MRTNDRAGHLQCPFCESYGVERLFLASLQADSCACAACGARWDEDAVTGEYRGRGFERGGLRPTRGDQAPSSPATAEGSTSPD